MIEQARESVKSRLAGLDLSSRVEFVQASAEDLPVEQGSVDLIVAGMSTLMRRESVPNGSSFRFAAQACHWFNWNKVWPEVARALRKDGTFAAWVRLPDSYLYMCFRHAPARYCTNISLKLTLSGRCRATRNSASRGSPPRRPSSMITRKAATPATHSGRTGSVRGAPSSTSTSLPSQTRARPCPASSASSSASTSPVRTPILTLNAAIER